MSPLLWTCKSTRHLAEALGTKGHHVSHQTVARLLTESGYNLQANRKTEEAKDTPIAMPSSSTSTEGRLVPIAAASRSSR